MYQGFENYYIYHAKTKEGMEILVQPDHIGRSFDWNFFVLAVLREEDKEYLRRLVTIGKGVRITVEKVDSKDLPLYVSWFTSPEYCQLLGDSES